MNLFSKLSTWYFSRKALPYWSIILLDCLVILFSGLLVYALNNGIFATMGIFWHLSLTWGVCLVPYLVGFRLFRTYSGIIRYSSFVDLQRVGFAVLFGVVCVVTFQEFTDFSPYLVYIRKRDLVLSSLLAMSLMWAMRVFVKYFYVTTFRQSKAERAFIFGVKQGGISLAKSIQNQDPAQYVLAGFVSEAGNMQNRILMGVRVYPFDEELIDAMRDCEKVCLHLHLPLQSGSSRILKLMNRRYTKEQYLDLVDRIRAKVPDVSLTTDIIVGFPGETEEDFLETMDVVRKVRYDSAFTFQYSRRTGTPAAAMEDQIPVDVVKDRFDRLLAEVQEISREVTARHTHTVQEVLVESINEQDPSLVTGRMSNNTLVHFKGDASLIGTLQNVYLDECRGFYYMGTPVENS